MTTNEIITELIRYGEDDDGFLLKILNQSERMKYLTDLNILHRVAVKVYHDIMPIITDIDKGVNWDAATHTSNIHYALLGIPINGEYITLANATADAIVYLKKYKACL